MAFRVIKQRREARRNAKLEEIFLERDKLQDETMSCQDMQDVFRMYGVRDIMIDILKVIMTCQMSHICWKKSGGMGWVVMVVLAHKN